MPIDLLALLELANEVPEVTTPVKPAGNIGKRAYRCNTCFCNFVTEHAKLERSAVCSICNSTGIEYLGEIHVDRCIREETRCNCDDRCVYATGPRCTCKCGGANHMAKQAGYSRVEVTTGLPAVFHCLDAELSAKHLAMATEYRAALNAAIARRDATQVYCDIMTSKFINDKDLWWKAKAEFSKFRKAADYKVHSKRMKALNESFPKI